MDPAEYDYMFRLEDSLWWYVGMRRIVYTLLRRYLQGASMPLQVLDAGCGTGGSLKLLERFGRVTGFDFSPQATELYLTRQRGRVCTASADAIPFADNSFDLITTFDVLCQMQPPADQAALAEMARVLKPGGTLLVRVPAYQALYGPHDATLHTRHRYSAGEMTAKMQKAGLMPLQTTYANTILFPIALARRVAARLWGHDREESDVRPIASPLNQALAVILSAETAILQRSRLPFGLSVIALARKP